MTELGKSFHILTKKKLLKARDKPGRSLEEEREVLGVAARYLTMHCATKTCLNGGGDKGERVGGMPERLHKGTFVRFSSLRPSQAR